MTCKRFLYLAGVTALLALSAAGCSRDNSQKPAPPNTDPIVFEDDFGARLGYQAFAGSQLDAVSIDTNESHEGTASLKISVPLGGYAGGAFTTDLARDLSGYNAMTFWARASETTILDVAGLGNDNTGTSKYTAELGGIALTTTWTKVIIPIPLPARLTSEQGLFFFADAPEGPAGLTLWFDEVKFETIATITDPRPTMTSRTLSTYVGAVETMTGTQVTFSVDGTDRLIKHLPGYFTFSSSNQAVATVTGGEIHVVGVGNSVITGKLGAIDATGAVTLNSTQDPTPPNIVFDDGLVSGVGFQAFLGSKVNALSVDTEEKHEGASSLKVTVPGPGDPAGSYAGGAFTDDAARDLSSFNALTFWAKSDIVTTLDVAGLGNDNTGTSKYEAKISGIALTSAWTKVIIPIPLSAKLSSEQGLFFFADGPEGATTHAIWFDDVKFETIATITNPRPAMPTRTLDTTVGTTLNVTGTQVTFSVDGTDRVVEHLPGYFTFASSNEAVATVTDGVIHVVGGGNAVITGKLGALDAAGALTLNVTAPPATAAATPNVPSADVISLFSNAYANVNVDTWSTVWDQADVADLKIAGNDTKMYSNLTFAGIEFTSATVDASAMTRFHMDVWVPAGTIFKMKLVDFGEDGVFGGAPDSEHEMTFNAGSTPALTTGTWVGLEIPLADVTGLVNRAHLAQIILSGDTRIVYVDNIYFHK